MAMPPMKSNKQFLNAAIGLAMAASTTLPYAAGAQSATDTANRPCVDPWAVRAPPPPASVCQGAAAKPPLKRVSETGARPNV